MEVCPSCGKFITVLNEETGWCYECSPPICSICGGQPHFDHRFKDPVIAPGSEVIYKFGKLICRRCIKNQWLVDHADEIEYHMTRGLGFTKACEAVNLDNRAVCVICDEHIVGRHKARTLFCTRHKRCRKAQSKYKRLMERYQLDRAEALEKVLIEFVEQERLSNGSSAILDLSR